MVITNKNTGVLLSICIGLCVTPSVFAEAGDIIVRAGATWVLPNDDSTQVSGIPGSQVSVDDDLSLGFTVGYMVSDNIGISLLGSWPFEHDLEGDGSISALNNIGSTKHLPPTLTVQYHISPVPRVNAYVGAGFNYTIFFDEDSSRSLDTALGGSTDIDLDNSFGLAAEVGVDVTLVDNWFVNFSAWYIDLDTEATLNTGGVKRNVDVDIDPWVTMIGVGARF